MYKCQGYNLLTPTYVFTRKIITAIKTININHSPIFFMFIGNRFFGHNRLHFPEFCLHRIIQTVLLWVSYLSLGIILRLIYVVCINHGIICVYPQTRQLCARTTTATWQALAAGCICLFSLVGM